MTVTAYYIDRVSHDGIFFRPFWGVLFEFCIMWSYPSVYADYHTLQRTHDLHFVLLRSLLHFLQSHNNNFKQRLHKFRRKKCLRQFSRIAKSQTFTVVVRLALLCWLLQELEVIVCSKVKASCQPRQKCRSKSFFSNHNSILQKIKICLYSAAFLLPFFFILHECYLDGIGQTPQLILNWLSFKPQTQSTSIHSGKTWWLEAQCSNGGEVKIAKVFAYFVLSTEQKKKRQRQILSILTHTEL